MPLAIPKGKRQSVAHTHAPRQEKQAAKRLGATQVPRSGAGDVKGDVRKMRVMRLECKSTSAKSFTVTRSMIEKIESAALASGELPAMEIEFLSPTGRSEGKVALVPVYVLEMMGLGTPTTS
jgi:hypothetical protein